MNQDQIEADLVMNTDGYWVFWPRHCLGYLDEATLAAILKTLQDKNAAWDAVVQELKEPPP